MITYLILLGIGMMAGTLGAMVGLGGGVIMLPAIQLFLAYDLLDAVGTTLFGVIFTSLSASLGHYRAGNVRLRSSALVGLGGLCGVLLGSFIFKQYLSNSLVILKIILGCFFALLAYRMGQEFYQEFFCKAKPGRQKLSTAVRPTIALVILGFVVGNLTGMVGLGGGFIITPGIMYICAVAPHVAVGTSMMAMLPVSLGGGLIKLWQGYVNLPAGIILGLGTALGAQLGVRLSAHISVMVMKGIFTVIFAAMAFDYLFPILK